MRVPVTLVCAAVTAVFWQVRKKVRWLAAVIPSPGDGCLRPGAADSGRDRAGRGGPHGGGDRELPARRALHDVKRGSPAGEGETGAGGGPGACGGVATKAGQQYGGEGRGAVLHQPPPDRAAAHGRGRHPAGRVTSGGFQQIAQLMFDAGHRVSRSSRPASRGSSRKLASALDIVLLTVPTEQFSIAPPAPQAGRRKPCSTRTAR